MVEERQGKVSDECGNKEEQTGREEQVLQLSKYGRKGGRGEIRESEEGGGKMRKDKKE